MYRIVHSSKTHQRIHRSLQLAALDELLPDDEVEDLCRQVGHAWRDRELPPGVTVRSMICRALHPDHSIAAMLAELAALQGLEDAPTDSAWCQARSRLPEAVLVRLIRRRTCSWPGFRQGSNPGISSSRWRRSEAVVTRS